MGRICDGVEGKRCQLDQLFVYGGLGCGGEGLLHCFDSHACSLRPQRIESDRLSIEIRSLTARDSTPGHASGFIPHKANAAVFIISYSSFTY